jgi:hypothetical protein
MAKRFSELGIKQQDDRKIFNCQQVPKEEFPFITTIRCAKCGNGKIYQFTS